MPEHRLISKRSTGDNIKSVDNEITNVIEFDVHEKSCFSQRKSKTYKVQVSVGISSNVLHPAFSVFDTGAGPSLIRTSFLPPAWPQKTKSVTGIRYRLASYDHIFVCGMIMFFVGLGDLRVRVRFGVVANLAVSLKPPILSRI